MGNRTWDISADVRVNPSFTQTEWLPRFDHFLLGQSLLSDRLTWLAHSHVGYARLQIAEPPSAENQALGDVFTYLPWESANGVTPLEAEGPRAATRQELDLPLDLGPFKVVPYALGELGYWGTTLDEQEVTRAYGQAGVRASLPFWRVDPSVQSVLFNLNGLAHKVTLDADFFWADANQNVDTFPLYDPLDDDGDEHSRRRFTTRTFGGVIPPQFEERFYAVRTGMQSWVTARSTEIADDLLWTNLGVRQRWQTKRGLPGRERVVDWISLDVDATYFPEPDRDNFGQPFGLFNYDFRWHVGDRLTLLSDGYADFFDEGLQTVMVGGQITRPERGNLFVSYRWFEGPFRSEILSALVAYRLSEKWVVTAGSVVDMTDTGNIGQSFGVTRIGESLLMQIGFNADLSRDNVGLNLAIEPRFLPRASWVSAAFTSHRPGPTDLSERTDAQRILRTASRVDPQVPARPGGIPLGVHGHSSFAIHLPCAALVVAIAGLLRVSRLEWSILLLCIFGVLTAELFNSALESVAKAIDTRHNPHLAAALDIASAAVLTSARAPRSSGCSSSARTCGRLSDSFADSGAQHLLSRGCFA